MMDNNKINLLGTVKDGFEHEYSAYGENFYSLTLDVERVSGTNDFIKLICSDRLMDVRQNIRGKMIEVYGSVRTRNADGHLKVTVFVDSLYLIEDSDCYIENENNVYLEGYICKRTSDCRETPLTNRVITDFILAVNHRSGRSSYIPCIAWNRNASYIGGLDIGTKIRLNGRLQSREYKKNDEIKVAYEVSINTVEAVDDEKEKIG